MVVVWISVDIGVGLVIVLLSYDCSGNCVDLLVVLSSSISLIVVRVFLEVLLVLVKIVWKFIVLNWMNMIMIVIERLKLLMWLVMNVFLLVVVYEEFWY